MINLKHALVIGGTGMLSTVSVWLSKNGYHVSVIGRNHEKMQRLINHNPSHMTSLLVDYTNSEELVKEINRSQKLNGPIQVVVAWIHSTGPDVIPSLSACISHKEPWKLFHINGSSSNLEEIKKTLKVPNYVRYYQIQLGFKIEKGISRWLTDNEISNGITDAIVEESFEKIIGIIEPWDKRP